ncbi:MAG: hypothetical protein ACYSUM_09530 [Planctomycetota bacterium]
MRWMTFGAIALAACASASTQEASSPPAKDDVARAISRTDVVLAAAREAVETHGHGQEKYRGAWMRQDAAKRALKQQETALAAKFTLQARRHALKTLQDNDVEIDAALARTHPAEEALKAQADDGEHDRWMEEAERRTPPAEELLQDKAPDAELRAQVERLMARSDVILEHARRAAVAGGKEKEKYRGAWMRQRAARDAMEAGLPRVAAKFSLQTRKLATKVVDANGMNVDPQVLSTSPAEKAIKKPVEDAPDATYDRMLAAVERDTPPADELLEQGRTS